MLWNLMDSTSPQIAISQRSNLNTSSSSWMLCCIVLERWLPMNQILFNSKWMRICPNLKSNSICRSCTISKLRKLTLLDLWARFTKLRRENLRELPISRKLLLWPNIKFQNFSTELFFDLDAEYLKYFDFFL